MDVESQGETWGYPTKFPNILFYFYFLVNKFLHKNYFNLSSQIYENPAKQELLLFIQPQISQ